MRRAARVTLQGMSALFEALIEAPAAWIGLPLRGVIRARGSDRVRFLNGMVSNDVEKLESGDVCAAFLLSRQGRIIAHMEVVALADELILDLVDGTSAPVFEALERHLIADDVVLELLDEDWDQIGLEGPGVATLLRERGWPEPPLGRAESFELAGERLLCLGGGSLETPGVRVMGPRAAVAASVEAWGLPELSAEHVEVLRIESFRPLYGVDMTDRNLPNEVGLEDALSHTKGCYVGQEVVARVRSRKAVRRLLRLIRTERGVRAGDPIRVGEREVGEITSAATSAAGGPVALGYIKASDADLGTALEVSGTAGVVVAPESRL